MQSSDSEVEFIPAAQAAKSRVSRLKKDSENPKTAAQAPRKAVLARSATIRPTGPPPKSAVVSEHRKFGQLAGSSKRTIILASDTEEEEEASAADDESEMEDDESSQSSVEEDSPPPLIAPPTTLFLDENQDLLYELGPEGVHDLKASTTSYVFTLWLHNTDSSQDPMVPNSIGRFLQKCKELCELKADPGSPQADYLFVGPREEAKTTGKPHRHGIIHLTKRKALRVLVNYFGFQQSLRFLVQKGTRAQARAYAIKELAPTNPVLFEFGKVAETPAPKGPGDRERNRWKQAYEACKREKLDLDEVDPQIAITSYKNLTLIHHRHQNSQQPLTLESCCGIFLFGPPNTGKSYFARNAEGRKPELCATMLYNNQQSFFDGCHDARFVLIEELGLQFKAWDQLKTWADRYPFNANLKGSNALIRPQNIIVTSNYHPFELYPGDLSSQRRRAINRRFRFIYFFREFDEFNPEPNFVEVMSYQDKEMPTMEQIFRMVPAEHRVAAKNLWQESNETPGTLASFNHLFPPNLSPSAFETPVQDKSRRNEVEATPPKFSSERNGTQPEVTPEPVEGQGNVQEAANANEMGDTQPI